MRFFWYGQSIVEFFVIDAKVFARNDDFQTNRKTAERFELTLMSFWLDKFLTSHAV